MGDKAFFDAQDIKRLHAVGAAAHFFGPRQQNAKQAIAIARGHRKLVAKLAAKGYSEKTGLDAHHFDGTATHERPAFRI